MYTACIFDLDGTLLDTIQDITDALNQALAERGLAPYAADQVREMLGHGVHSLIEASMPENAGRSDWSETILKSYLDLYMRGCMNKTKPYPGVSALLTSLQEKGVQLMVLSNKSENNTIEMVAHYFPDIRFLRVSGGRPDRPLKPDPTVVKEFLSDYALTPEKTLFIGDSNVDIQTAKNARMPSVGVTWGYRDRAELEAAGAEYIVKRAPELLTIVTAE